MISRLQLVVASWPLSPFQGERPGDQALAQQLLGHLPASPAILIDGVPFPPGPIIRDREIPDPNFRTMRLEADLFYAADLRQLPVKEMAETPLTHHALDSLKRRYAKSVAVRLPDLLPPESLVEADGKFPDVRLISAKDRRQLEDILGTPFPPASDFDPYRLIVMEPPWVPPVQRELDSEELAEAMATGEPALHFPSPPEGVEVVTVTPVDEEGRTMGGRLPPDLWRIFVSAGGSEDLHERLGIADTFCYRYSGRAVDQIMDILGTSDPSELGWEQPPSAAPYCDGRCVEEQDAMREWIDREEWHHGWGGTVARQRLIGAEEVDIENSSAWEVIRARHAPDIEAILADLEALYCDDDRGFETLHDAYSSPRFVEAVSRPRKIVRVWGFLPYMWLRLQQNIEEQGLLPVHCGRCGGFITKTKANKVYCSEGENTECWKAGLRERQAANRSRRRGC